jgi:FkbM family methyltransferase
MNNIFDKLLHYYGQNKEKLFLINIGAMDGVMFDELIGYSNMYDYKGLYVEPIPYLFKRLKNNLSKDGNLFENSAVSDYDGEITMLTIPQEVIDNNKVHPCFYGMSAVWPPKNGLGSEGDKETVEKYAEKVDVKCITFENLLKKHKIKKFDILSIDTEGHDYQIFKQIDLKKHRPKLIRLEWNNLTKKEQREIIKKYEDANYFYEITHMDIDASPKEVIDLLEDKDVIFEEEKEIKNESGVTFVTGLWDIKRGDLDQNWSRSYDHYLEKFDQLLSMDNNMIIYGDSDLESFVWARRKEHNTQFIKRNLNWFVENEYYNKIKEIRENPEWINQAGWLQDSTQAKLEMYNPLVMGKMFLLNDAGIFDKFNSTHLFWIDAGITNTVHQGYFTHDKIQDKFSKIFNNFTFVAFPYEATNEIHGFSYPKINSYANKDVKLVCRGGLFGGPKHTLSDINSIYYILLNQTLNDGYMGTEESIFSIMLYKYSDLIDYVRIEENGLISKFCEDVKNNEFTVRNISLKVNINKNLNTEKTALYVITFNSPKQFETLIESMLVYDDNFIKKPKKYLLDNSDDLSTTIKYEKLCEKYDFVHIKKDNLGICGGRQFIAEHAEKNNFDFYFFFEDDMFLNSNSEEVCRNGFNVYVENLYESSLKIVKNNGYDFLKLSFTEFFGDNRVQWSWYNVPQAVREKIWPENKQLPVSGLDPNAPKTKFNNISCFEGIPYIDGEIYYCNWPQIVTRHGNKKMFLTEKWAYPFEQTWMSYIFQETLKGNIKGSLLLMTPISHNRFDHYSRSLRKES